MAQQPSVYTPDDYGVVGKQASERGALTTPHIGPCLLPPLS